MNGDSGDSVLLLMVLVVVPLMVPMGSAELGHLCSVSGGPWLRGFKKVGTLEVCLLVLSSGSEVDTYIARLVLVEQRVMRV